MCQYTGKLQIYKFICTLPTCVKIYKKYELFLATKKDKNTFNTMT